MTDATTNNAESLVSTGTGVAARFTSTAPLHERYAYTAANLVEYIGIASVATGTGTAGWAIAKLTYSGNNVVSKTWASGTADFDKIWDDRATYTYQ